MLETIVDPEISFKIKDTRRGSSSSEDQVNTSDELMDVDNFIADCEAQAKKDRQPNEDQLLRPSASHHQGDNMIREAEAGRVHVLATTSGKQQPSSTYGSDHGYVYETKYDRS